MALHCAALSFSCVSWNPQACGPSDQFPRSSSFLRKCSTINASAFSSPSPASFARFRYQGKALENGNRPIETDESSLVVCFGEMLIDFVPTTSGLSLSEAPAFKKAPGGAPANVAVGIARLGGTSAFIGKVGEDEFGYMLADILKENNVNNEGMRFDPGARTALAFVTLTKDGEREFMFYRNPSLSASFIQKNSTEKLPMVPEQTWPANQNLWRARISKVTEALTLVAIVSDHQLAVWWNHERDSGIRNKREPVGFGSRTDHRSRVEAGLRVLKDAEAKIFHYGSISLITEPCRSAHIAATKAAKDAGVILSYDPNLRLPLWPSAESAREGILSIWDTADIIKISVEEICFLTNGEDPYDDNVVRKLYHQNLKLLLVTEGPEGCRYYTKEFSGRVKGLKVDPVDTTGAGDAFVAGILSQLASDTSLFQNEDRLRDALRFANACGALTVTERGAIPALPTQETVLNAVLKLVA
ncbi:probable fructokinase-6 chloroplastic [Phtheirospermum japonicum]|uniref:Probable fructokinase-6 chloroplastic n=1 Tax=Phtheirospermum japonicum TaxID=374723 RepID=A0A830CKI7_9LAMI|nr:probable fructokinase-6 chloroplastic [Phtheirospermum japonicum]